MTIKKTGAVRINGMKERTKSKRQKGKMRYQMVRAFFHPSEPRNAHHSRYSKPAEQNRLRSPTVKSVVSRSIVVIRRQTKPKIRSKPTWDDQKVKAIFHKSAPSVEFHINFDKLMEHSKNTYNYIGKKHDTKITVTLEGNVLLIKGKTE